MTARDILIISQREMQALMGPDYEVHSLALSVNGPKNLRVSGLVTRGFTSSFGFNVMNLENVTDDMLPGVLKNAADKIVAMYVQAVGPGEAA